MTDKKMTNPVLLYRNETVEDLQRNGMRLIQPAYGFRFGEDSVLLAANAVSACPKTSRRIQVADIGAGSGAVSILMAARDRRLDIRAIELDRHRFDCLQRNISLNDLSCRMYAHHIDLKVLASREKKTDWPAGLKAAECDIVVMNPPYRLPAKSSLDKWNSGKISERSALMAGEEIAVSLEELLQAAARLLKPGGRLVMVHRPQRLPDIIDYMRKTGIEPVSLQVLESLPAKAPSRIIIIGRKSIKSGGFRWLAPLTVYSQPGQMTSEAAELYGHEYALSEEQLLAGTTRLDSDFNAEETPFASCMVDQAGF